MSKEKSTKSKSKSEKEIKITDEVAENTEPQTGEAANEEKETEAPQNSAEELKTAQEKIAELQDKYLRQAAEFDNYRKRMLKEKSELILNGGEKVISLLLPVLDDFERALTNIKKGGDEATLSEGVELIFQKLFKVLETQGLKQIETEENDFDTDFHEAIAMIPSEKEGQKGKVVDCVQKGYTLNGKVIRHAKVVVGQ